MEPIITSLLDTDLYKLTMMQAVLHRYPQAHVRYEFRCRSAHKLGALAERVEAQVGMLRGVALTKDEAEYLRSLRFMKDDFVDFLSLFRFNPDYVQVSRDGDELRIAIEGPWLHTILFEVPLLAIVAELEFETHPDQARLLAKGRERLEEKLALLRSADVVPAFAEFGTRRRAARRWQTEVVNRLLEAKGFSGTSNVDLARRFGLLPIGTMAHEWLQAHQALGARLVDSQKAALEAWVQEYRGDLGIALTDVIGMDAFTRDFDLYFAKLFDGLRHDSGDPVVWAETMIAHYRALRIDPRSKQLVFSDGLDVEQMIALEKAFGQQAKIAFGVGTNLTHDLGIEPPSVVIKMTECQGQPVAKLSDSAGKTMCRDASYLNYLCSVFGKEAA
ncbi:nicotinate phosphoribosyltransferase [Alkalilimnicola ehrlichii]|uniref:Nicotinate phosphoribosyltransferase n=1 Tax=Alkalilimnicola ehrlichii TaxID=351052 RepID=A0A3E0WPT2_9GAMM|nr:nicotinate phosphoribosyltransferase [Alkalilimnicola ehrlichii]RFA28228.1 nicotinate phosphoribosyltransferase [Alkalilimnicola ehrlichii]RFA34828.1 nicotinate phosphoribosyltransferase [Alkalilimnicola ehrlichii]